MEKIIHADMSELLLPLDIELQHIYLSSSFCNCLFYSVNIKEKISICIYMWLEVKEARLSIESKINITSKWLEAIVGKGGS